MSDQTIETIDSSEMRVLAEFRYVDEVVLGGADHYAVGVLGENVVIRTTGALGLPSADFFYERANHTELTSRIEDALAGKLREQAVDHFIVKRGKDYLIVSVIETFPHTSMKPLVKLKLTNNRKASLDKTERGGWFLYMSIETGKKLVEEMNRVKAQIVDE